MNGGPHTPVMLAQVLDAIRPRDGGVYVDATFGAGGYTRALLEAADCVVWAIDRDPRALKEGAPLAEAFAGRLNLIEGRFGDMDGLLEAQGVAGVDGVAMDVGVSSMQLDRPERGFSFRHDGPLDMRMGGDGPTAADIVNDSVEGDLVRIIKDLGEERSARAVARAIVRARAEARIETTARLAEIVRSAVRSSPKDRIDPATRTFQGLRIAVNDEIGELKRGLAGAERLLTAGGVLAVVSFHSLEDREVKLFFKRRSGATARPSRHVPEAVGGPSPTFTLLHRGAVKPTELEVAANPRARSARLRAGVRTDAPPWPEREAA